MTLVKVTESEARSLLIERGANEMLAQSKGYALSGAWVCRTSWHVEGDLKLDQRTYGGGLVIVDGDLHVSGLLEDTGEDTSGTTFFGVMESVRTRDLWTSDFVFVAKDLIVTHTLYGNSSSNRGLFVDGRIDAEVLIMDGHSYECDRVRAKHEIDVMEETGDRARVLAEGLLDEDDAIDQAALRAAMEAGRSITVEQKKRR